MLNPGTIKETENFGYGGDFNESLDTAERTAKAVNDFWCEQIECGPLFGEFGARVGELDHQHFACFVNGEPFDDFDEWKAEWIKGVRAFCDKLEKGEL